MKARRDAEKWSRLRVTLGLEVSRRAAVGRMLRLKDREILAQTARCKNSCFKDRETENRMSLISLEPRFAGMVRQSHDP